ncbi:MAG: class I SAM-dependent methyltransferase [Nitrospirae bacterium]|nr:MAG: class I SAM-dependent methyltransferase [Nitrospirota bacterium]
MRDWSTEKTANWWEQADLRYNNRGENEPSTNYFAKHFKFDSVLEIGSGTGRLINSLPAERKGAMDINPYLLDLVDNKAEKYEYDISKPIPLNLKYDLVFTYQVLQHLNHDQFLKALENIKRFAKKEIWLIEGQVPNAKDGELTHEKGSWHHDYAKYLDCYKIDGIHGNKIKVFRSLKQGKSNE